MVYDLCMGIQINYNFSPNKWQGTALRAILGCMKQRNNSTSIKHWLWGIGITAFGLITLAVLWCVHRAIPFMMDDLWYSTKLANEEPVRTLGDILSAQIWHYQNWGGRSMTHGLLQLLLMAGEPVADVCNVVVTLLLSFLLYRVALGERPLRRVSELMGVSGKAIPFLWIGLISLGIGLLIGFNANWKMSMFWQAGAANYLYISLFEFFFLWTYLRELGTVNVSPLKGIVFWILPLGLISGWSNENMGPTLWLLSLAAILYFKKIGHSVRLWMLLGNVSCFLGSVLCILAPGNLIRSREADQGIGLLWKLFLRGYAQATGLFSFLFPLLLYTLFLILGVLYFGKGHMRLQDKFLLLGALLSWMAFVLSPHYPDRASFGTMVFLLCADISLQFELLQTHPKMNYPFLVINGWIWFKAQYVLLEYLAIYVGWIR